MYWIYFKLVKKTQKIPTRNWWDLETLQFSSIMPKNLLGNWSRFPIPNARTHIRLWFMYILCKNFGQFQPPIWHILDCKTIQDMVVGKHVIHTFNLWSLCGCSSCCQSIFFKSPQVHIPLLFLDKWSVKISLNVNFNLGPVCTWSQVLSHLRPIHAISTVESMKVETYHVTWGPESRAWHGCLGYMATLFGGEAWNLCWELG